MAEQSALTRQLVAAGLAKPTPKVTAYHRLGAALAGAVTTGLGLSILWAVSHLLGQDLRPEGLAAAWMMHAAIREWRAA